MKIGLVTHDSFAGMLCRDNATTLRAAQWTNYFTFRAN